MLKKAGCKRSDRNVKLAVVFLVCNDKFPGGKKDAGEGCWKVAPGC